MSFSLLLPAALAALGALLLPLLIHLARRSQMRPTPFAALRWLRQAARPQRRLRLEELPLLLLRLLLVALLALWLARPVLHGGQTAAAWVVAVPGVDPGQVQALVEGPEPARWLAPGFPLLDQPSPDAAVPVASLLRQLDAGLPADATVAVAVPERLEAMDAQRPVLSRAVTWRVLPGAMPAAAAPVPAPPALNVRHDDGGAAGLRYLRAAALAWHGAESLPEGTFSVASTAGPVDPGSTHLVWLAGGAVPEPVLDWVEQGGVALFDVAAEVALPDPGVAWWRDASGGALVEGAAHGRGRLLRFTRPLQPRLMPELLDPDFPRSVRAVLQEPVPPASVAAAAHAPLAGADAWPQAPRELRPWLALAIALVLLLERWLATSRRRWPAADAARGRRA